MVRCSVAHQSWLECAKQRATLSCLELPAQERQCCFSDSQMRATSSGQAIGMAGTLANLCLGGRYRDVITGDALYESLGGYAGKDQVLLGCFALAGDAGLPLEVVATYLGRSQDHVHRALSHLAAGGIIRVGS